MSTIEDSDLFLVNRPEDSKTYKVTGGDLLEYTGGAINPDIDDIEISPPVSGSGTQIDPYVLTTLENNTPGGFVTSVETIKINNQRSGRQVVWTNNSDPATGTRFDQPITLVPESGDWEGHLQYLDNPPTDGETIYPGSLEIGDVYFSWTVDQKELSAPPLINSVTLTEIEDGISRYTDKEFPYTTDMIIDGNPSPDFGVKAKFSGTTFDFATQSETITGVAPGGSETFSTDYIQSVQEGEQASVIDWNVGDAIQGFPLTDISTWVAENGITSISGFKFVVHSAEPIDGYSTELRAFQINNVSVRGSGNPVTAEQLDPGGGWYSNLTPENWMSGAANVVQASGTPGSTSSFFFDPLPLVGTVQIELVAARNNVYLIDGDGKEWLLIGTGQNRVLDFASNKDFDEFDVGEVVQIDDNYLSGDYLTDCVTGGTVYGSWNNVFDGVISTGSSESDYFSPATADVVSSFTPSTPIPVNESVQLYGLFESPTGGGDKFSCRLNGSQDLQTTPTGAYGAEVSFTAEELGGELKSIELLRVSTSAYLAGIKVDGRTLIDPSVSTVNASEPVTIVSKDKDIAQMVVSGGNWATPLKQDFIGNTTGTPDPSYPIERSFDGNTGTFALSEIGGELTTTFDPPLDCTVLTISTFTSGVQPAGAFMVNDIDYTNLLGDGNEEITIPLNTLRSVTQKMTTGSVYVGIRVINVDGVGLVQDPNVEAGDTKLSKTEVWGTELTFSGPTGLDEITGDVVMWDGSDDVKITPYKLVTTDIESVAVPPQIEWSADVNYNPVPNDTGSNLFNGGDLAANASFDFVWTAPADLYASKVAVDFNSEVDGITYSGTITTNFNTYSANNGTREDYRSAGPGFSGIRYAFNLSEGEKLVSVGVSSGSTRYISKIFLDDQELIDNVPYPDGLILTFADPNPDLKYFRPGDAVGSGKGAVQNINQSGAAMHHNGGFGGFPTNFGNGVPTISYADFVAAAPAGNKWNNVFKPNVSVSFTYQLIELEYAANTIQFTTQSSYVITACSKDGVTWEQAEQSPANQTATSRTVTGGPFKYWYIGFNADTGDNTANYYLSCNAEAYVDVKVVSTDLVNNTMVVDGGDWDNSNRSQAWSNLVTNPGGTLSGSVKNGFNGVLAAPYATYFGGAFPANCAELAIPVSASDTVFVICQSDVQPFLVDAGNGTQTFEKTSGANTRIDISSAFGTNVTSWKMGSTGNWNFAGIEINGKILVDAINDSEVWSDYLVCTGGFMENRPKVNAFDGDITTLASSLTQNDPFVFTPPTPINYTTSVRVHTQYNGSFTLNAGTASEVSGISHNGTVEWKELASGPGTLISITGSGAGNFTVWDAVEIDGVLLVDQGVSDFGQTNITLQTDGGYGTIVSTDPANNKMRLSNTGGDLNRWIANNKDGISFKAAPPDGVPITSDSVYGVLEIVDDKALVTAIQMEDPGFKPVTSKDYSIKLPKLFATGNAPDVDLPRGVTIQVEVEADNELPPVSTKLSNVLMPADVNAAGVSGPITETTPTSLTVSSASQLNTFVDGDTIQMCDDQGVPATYTIQTSEIESVSDDSGPSSLQAKYYASGITGAASDLEWNPATARVDGDLTPNTNWDGPGGSVYMVYSPTPFIATAGRNGSTSIAPMALAASNDGTNYVVVDWHPEPDYKDPDNCLRSDAPYSYYALYRADEPNKDRYGTNMDGGYSFGAPVSSVVLTFTDPNPDLKYFRAGDIIQSPLKSPVIHTVNEPDGGWADGTVFTMFDSAALDMSSTDVQYVPDNTEPVPAGKAYKQLVFDLLNSEGDFAFGAAMGGWATASSVDGVNWIEESTEDASALDNPTKSVRSMMKKQPNARYIAIGSLNAGQNWSTNFSIRFNQQLVDTWNEGDFSMSALPSVIAAPKVVSVDTSENEMVVDGGNWNTSNQSQVWSSLTTVTGTTTPGGGAEAFYDGVAEGDPGQTPMNYARLKDGYLELTHTFTDVQTVEISSSWSGAGGTIQYNDLAPTSIPGSANTSYSKLLMPTPPSTVNKIKFAVTGGPILYLSKIWINGSPLIDPINDSKVWSDLTVASLQSGTVNPLYDGTVQQDQIILKASTNFVLSSVGVTASSISLNTDGSVDSTLVVVNGLGVEVLNQSFTPHPSTGAWETFTLPADSEISSITIVNGSAGLGVNGIKLDGRLLIDEGVNKFGANSITFEVPPATATFKSATTEAPFVVTVEDSNDRFIDNTNRLGTDFYFRDVISVLDANNSKHVALQTAIRDAFAAFPVNVAERRSKIAASLYKIIGGTPLTAEEIEDLETTVMTAVNASEPFAYDGYYPLYYTPEKANSASPQSSSHTHTLDGNTYFMPDGVTLYHGTYTS